jgi:hypothetical protein
MANRFINPNPQFFLDNGEVNAGGSLTFYLTQTSTPAATFINATLTTPNSAPVPFDSAGRPEESIFLDPAITYKVVHKDADGIVIWTEDPVVDPAANVTAAIQVYAGNPNGNLAGNQGAVGGSGASTVYDITNQLLYVCTATGTAATAVWTQIGATLSGQVAETGVSTPTALAVDTDNWDPQADQASHVRIDLSADVTVTGMAGGSAGVVRTIHNISSAKRLKFGDDTFYTSSTAANRFKFGGKNQFLYPGDARKLWWDTSDSRWRLSEGPGFMPLNNSGFRLTLTTATPVMTANTTAQTTVYYTPYLHNFALLYNGSQFYVEQFSELSQTLADATKSPAAGAVNKLYDMFLWNDAGTIRCTRGPAWSSSTARGAGAGTTELERVSGVWLNKVSISNGPAANRGVYVGTIATDGNGANGQLNMNLVPAAAAGGTNNKLDVWNMYNRVDVTALCRPSDDTWAYNATATIRAANASNSNRITFVRGLDEDAILAIENQYVVCGAGATLVIGIGLDSTTVISGLPARSTSNQSDTLPVLYTGLPGIGQHFLQMLESCGGGNGTFYGDNGDPTLFQSGLMLKCKM